MRARCRAGLREPHATSRESPPLLHPLPRRPAGIHPSAIVAADAQVDSTAQVGALVLIGDRAVIGRACHVGPRSFVEEDVTIDEDVHLVGAVTLCHRVQVGARTCIQPGAVIGGDGFGFAPRAGPLDQGAAGRHACGSAPDVEIGANTTIDRGAIERHGASRMASSSITRSRSATTCRIGAHTAIAACVRHFRQHRVGKRCMIGGAVGIAGHITICDDVVVTGLRHGEPFDHRARRILRRHSDRGGRIWRRIVGRV